MHCRGHNQRDEISDEGAPVATVSHSTAFRSQFTAHSTPCSAVGASNQRLGVPSAAFPSFSADQSVLTSCEEAPVQQYAGPQEPSSEAESDSVMQKNFVSPGDDIEHCSSRIFNELRQRMKVETEFFDAADAPTELLDGSGVESKTMLYKRFLGYRGWSAKGKVAVVRLLLAYDCGRAHAPRTARSAIAGALHICLVVNVDTCYVYAFHVGVDESAGSCRWAAHDVENHV